MKIQIGRLVKVIGIEPERFSDDPETMKLVLTGKHPLIGKTGIIDTVVGKPAFQVKVLIDGKIEWFDPWDLEFV